MGKNDSTVHSRNAREANETSHQTHRANRCEASASDIISDGQSRAQRKAQRKLEGNPHQKKKKTKTAMLGKAAQTMYNKESTSFNGVKRKERIALKI